MGFRYRRKRRLSGILGLVVFCFGIAIVSVASPVTGFDPLCSTLYQYEGQATIQYKGNEYSSAAIRKVRTSRDWIRNLNSDGCSDNIGTAFVFKTNQNQVLTMKTSICLNAKSGLSDGKDVDVKALCMQTQKPSYGVSASGYLFPNASSPTSWAPFWFDHVQLAESQEQPNVKVKLVRWLVKKSNAEPFDELGEKAPALLRVKFHGTKKYTNPHSTVGFQRQRPFKKEHGEINSRRIKP